MAAKQTPQIIRARNGQASLYWRDLYWHSRHNPQKEAERQIAALNIANEQQLVVFIGAGLGYALRQFCQQYRNPVVWFEPHPEIAQLAIQHSKLQLELSKGRIRLLGHMPNQAKPLSRKNTPSPKKKTHKRHKADITNRNTPASNANSANNANDDEWQQLFGQYHSQDIIFCGHRPSYTADAQYHNFHKELEIFLNRKSVNQATLARFDKLWMRNLLANAPILLRAQPIKKLFNTQCARAALVCGAGPSLAQDIHVAQALRKKVLLIAVDTALRPLQQHGIAPDLVVCVDPQAVSRHYVTTHAASPATAFVIDPSVSYLCLRLLQNRSLFYFWSPFALAQLIFDCHNETEPGQIAFGGSVSTNAYDLAVQMGCDPILLLGQDLAFSQRQAHARGAALEELHYHQQSRLVRHELYHYRQMSALPVRYVRSIHNKNLATNDKLLIFHQWFCRRLPGDVQKGFHVANLSSDGAAFPGAAPQNWRDYQDLPDQNWTLENLALAPPTKHDYAPAAQKLSAKFAALAQDFTQYAQLSRQGHALAQQMLNTLPGVATPNTRYEKLLNEIKSIDAQLLQKSELSAIAGSVLQKLLLDITDAPLAQHKIESAQEHLRLAEQSRSIYKGLMQAAQSYKDALLRAERVLQHILNQESVLC